MFTRQPTTNVFVTVSTAVTQLFHSFIGRGANGLSFISRRIQTRLYRTPAAPLDRIPFTPSNWNLPQTVRVRGIDDAAAEGERFTVISHTISATSDSLYRSSPVPNVNVRLIDNDKAGVALVESDNSTRLIEGSASDNYWVFLHEAAHRGDSLLSTSVETGR